jgi:hypothetical protein
MPIFEKEIGKTNQKKYANKANPIKKSSPT